MACSALPPLAPFVHVTSPTHAVSVIERLEPRRLLAAGDFDPTFGASGINSFGIGPDGAVFGLDERNGATVVVSRHQDKHSTEPRVSAGFVDVFRLNSAGLQDDTFSYFDDSARSALDRFTFAAGVVVQADNQIVFTGGLRDRTSAICRLRADGSLDTTFGTRGICRLPLS